ncbi:MAG: SPOR domain-containing protein [Thiotrichaceae bacterium]
MTKDYKKTTDDGSQSGNYGWMLSGIALGLLVGLGMYFYSNHKASLAIDQVNQAASTDAAAFGENENSPNADSANNGIQEPDPVSVVIESAREEQQDRKRATFSYYAVLPNLELDVTIKPSEKDSPVETEATEKVILKPGTHLLQIASFKAEKPARRVQSELGKQGLETRIEKRLIKGTNWFRLFAGPTELQADINTWKSLVEKAGFKPLVVKVK